MKKYFLKYIFVVVFLLFAALVFWPQRWINIDIKNFHYHQLWRGPALEDFTFSKFKSSFDFLFGREFIGAKRYKVTTSDVSESEVLEIAKILRKRLDVYGVKGYLVNFKKEEDGFVIDVEVSSARGYEKIEKLLTAEGKFEFWADKPEDQVNQNQQINYSGNDFSLRSLLLQNYTDLEIEGNHLIGTKIESFKDGYSLRLVLEDATATALANKVYSFYGKSIFGFMDENFIPIDGADLGEKISLYGKAKSVNLVGIDSIETAKMYAALISNKPIEKKLVIEGSSEINGIFQSANQRILFGGILLSILVIFLVNFFMFRKYSFIEFIISVSFVFIEVMLFKIFNIEFVFNTIFVIALGLGILMFSRGIENIQSSLKDGVIFSSLVSISILGVVGFFINMTKLSEIIIALILTIFSIYIVNRFFAILLDESLRFILRRLSIKY